MIWPPKMWHSFTQNCCWITVQFSHHERWKTCVKNGRKSNFSRRLKQFDGFTWLTLTRTLYAALRLHWFCVRQYADARPRLNEKSSPSTVRSHICLGRPGLLFQFFDRPETQVRNAREWSGGSQLWIRVQTNEDVLHGLCLTKVAGGFLIVPRCW